MPCYYLETFFVNRSRHGFYFLTQSQGMFNLAVLVQQGHVLPSSVRRLFEVLRHDERDVVVEKILKR